MLQPKTIGAIAFVAVAGLGAWWELSRDDANKETEAPPNPVPSFSETDVDALLIHDAATGTTVGLSRDGDRWQLTEPIADEADPRNVNNALLALSKARVSPRPAASSRESWDKLQIGPEQTLTVTLRKAGTDIVVLHVSLDGKFVRVGDADPVYQAHGINRAMLARELKTWRNSQVIVFDKAAVKAISVATADGRRAAAERTPAPAPATPPAKGTPPARDTWTLTVGQQLVGQLDPDVPVGIVARMQNLSAQDFADDKTKAAAGLAPPQLTVTVTLEDGTVHALEVGADADDAHRYISRGDSGRVWLAAKNTLDSFARAPVQWRDKTIAKISPDDIVKIDVTHAGFRLVAEKSDVAWKVLHPKGLAVDKAKLDAIATAMQNLRGTAIATDVAAKAFRSPEVVAQFTTKDRRQLVVSFGAQRDKQWPAKANTRKDVVWVADYLVQRLRVTEADLTAGK